MLDNQLKGRAFLDALRPKCAESGLPGVYVWQLTGAERLEFEVANDGKSALERLMALARMSLGDDSGRFAPPYDVGALPAEFLPGIYEAAAKVNVMSKESAEETRGN